MPQSDLLAHKNTRAFITHCGANSLYEVTPLSLLHWPLCIPWGRGVQALIISQLLNPRKPSPFLP